MACNKYQLINTGTTNAYITFRRCEDGAYERNYECIPYRIYNLWVMDDTLTSAEMSQLALEYEGTFPPTQPTEGIGLKFDVTGGDEYIYFASDDTITVTVDWGDGTVDEVTDTSYEFTHTYSTGIQIAKVTFSDPLLVYDFEVYQSNLVNTSNNFSLLPNLTDLWLNNNKMVSFEPDFLSPILEQLELYTNQLTSFAPACGIPNSVYDLDISSNSLSCSELTDTLLYLKNTYLTNPDVYIDNQSECACIDDQTALDAITNLEDRGYNIYSDIC